jgi:DNA-binding XRE family transcriptional regulator
VPPCYFCEHEKQSPTPPAQMESRWCYCICNPNVVCSRFDRLKSTSIIWGVSNDICVRFGKRLRKLRMSRGWTQVYMAEHVGIDRSYISDLENGKKEICIRNLEVIATTFDMTVSQLMTRI